MNKKKNIEYETKVLDIDVEEVVKKLRELGAEEFEEKFMKRWVFDFYPRINQTIRVRDEGDKITLTYKQKSSPKIGDTEEIEIIISDFDKAAAILHRIGVEGIYYQENKRKLFKLGKTEFCLDTWPNLETYLEVESDSVAGVKKGLALLSLTGKDIGNLSVWHIYQKKGVDIHQFKQLKF